MLKTATYIGMFPVTVPAVHRHISSPMALLLFTVLHAVLPVSTVSDHFIQWSKQAFDDLVCKQHNSLEQQQHPLTYKLTCWQYAQSP